MNIFELIDSSDIVGVKAWIENKTTNKNFANCDEDSPLIYALCIYKEEIANLFIEKNFYIFHVNNHGQTPLHFAAVRNYIKITLLLIEKGANVDASTANGLLPIHYAAIHGTVEVVQILIENGSEINTINNSGRSPLAESIFFARSFKTSKILLDEGAALFNNINYLSIVYENYKTLVKYHFKLQAFILVCKEKDKMLSCLSRYIILKFSKTFKLSFKK